MTDRRVWVLVATILASSMAFIDSSAVNVALPLLQADLHATVSEVQWVVEAYLLLLSALTLVGGALGDRYGRKRLFLWGVSLFTLASAACGLVSDPWSLILARGFQGVGAALLVPGSLAILGSCFSGEARGKAVGTWSSFSAMTSAVGPVLGGWLVGRFTWRAIFFLNLPLALVVIAATLHAVPESHGADIEAKPDVVGALLAVFGLGSLAFGLTAWSMPQVPHRLAIVGLGLGILGLLLLGAWEALTPAPMVPLKLFRSLDFTVTNALTLLLYAALSAVLFFVPFDLIGIQHYTPLMAGAALAPFALLMFALSRFSGGLAERVGPRVPLVLGPLLAAVGMALFALPGVGGPYWATFMPPVLVLGLGMAITVAPLTTTVLASAGSEHAGVASGINNAIARVAGLLAIALLGLALVTTFEGQLRVRLSDLPLSPPARFVLLAHAPELLAAPLPTGMSPDVSRQVRHARSEAFVAGFRLVMIQGALLAASGGLLAAVAWRKRA